MIDLSGFGLTADFWEAMGGLFFLALLAKFTRSEMRTLTLGLVGVILAPTPATCYVVGVLALVFKLMDVWRGD